MEENYLRVQKFLLILNIILGILLALSAFILFPVCADLKPDGTYMKCFYSGIFITAMGVLIILFNLKKVSKIFIFMTMLCAVLCWLVPNKILIFNNYIGLCGDPAHACRAVTMPAVGVLVILIIVLCAVRLILNFLNS